MIKYNITKQSKTNLLMNLTQIANIEKYSDRHFVMCQETYDEIKELCFARKHINGKKIEIDERCPENLIYYI